MLILIVYIAHRKADTIRQAQPAIESGVIASIPASIRRHLEIKPQNMGIPVSDNAPRV